MAETTSTGGAAIAPDSPIFRSATARALEWIIVPAVLLVITGSFHLHAMLTMGDWDFWLDWKDREFWIVVTPTMIVTYCGALHYILWHHFRLPFGATFAVGTLLLAEWIVRYFGWHIWSNFPVNLVTPAFFWPGALALDAVLCLSGSWIVAGVFGASFFGASFYGANWAWLAAYHVPLEVSSGVTTLADRIGFEYIRTGTPEYIRIIERGTLRTFGQHSAAVSSGFAAFLCTLMYWLWWYIGGLFSTVKYIKSGSF